MGASNIPRRKMAAVSVENRQKKLRLNPKAISQIAKTVLRREGIKEATLSLVFVSARTIRSYNQRFLQRDYATDVLSFDLSEEGRLIADIVISTDAVLKNAKRFNQSRAQELSLYIIHGILHLCGFDDHRPSDIKRMRKREEALMSYLGPKTATVIS